MCEGDHVGDGVYEKQQKERRRMEAEGRMGKVAEKAMELEAAWWHVTCSSR